MRSRLAWLYACLVFVSACGRAIDSPRPTVAGSLPDLVCNAQLTTAVTVNGTNFTPLPEKTLAQPEVLQLPQVSLTETSDLSGAAAMSTPVVINPNPADPTNPHVRWESEQQLTFDVTPDLMIAPGVYDVTITNADKHGATLPHSLAVVPPPSVTKVVPANICDAQGDQSVVITGNNFLVVGDQVPTVTINSAGQGPSATLKPVMSNCSPIATNVMAGLQLCTTMTITITKGSLPPGMYTLTVTNPAPANCASVEVINFVVEPPPKIDSVLPTHLCAGGGNLDVKGSGFLPGAKVTLTDPTAGSMMSLDGNPVMVSADGKDANATFGGGWTAGDKLDVTLTNADGCTSTLPASVTVVPGPIIFYVDPPFVYGAITTPVTVYTTGITTPLPATGAVVLTPNGAMTPKTDLTSASHIDPAHPKHVIIDVPPTLAAGAYDLTITDASGCPAFYAKAITVVSTKTTLKDIQPPFGDDATSTPVTIDATAAFFQPGARAYLAPHANGSTLATALSAVVFQSNVQLTAIVEPPTGGRLTDALYDLVTVNPDGTIGFLDSAFTVVATAPPVLTGSAPGTLPTNCGVACNVTLTGNNLTPSPMVTATCTPPGGTPVATTINVTGTPTSTAVTINIPTIPGTAGTVCAFRVTVGAAYADGGVMVVTNPAAKLTATAAGQPLTTARRAPGLVYGKPTSAASYLYAIGGDTAVLNAGGLPTAPLASVEIAKADGIFGTMGTWSALPNAGATASNETPPQGQLPTATTLAGAVTIGRFIYHVGGYDGSNSVKTVLRAQILDPADAPQINDADLTTDPTTGLAPGLYFYRVAAVLAGSDANNPGGETLAGDEFAIKVPTFGTKKIQVTVSWTGGPASVASWRVYRTTAPGAAPGSEDLVYQTANASGTTLLDQGTVAKFPAGTPNVSVASSAGKPLEFGALGQWKTLTAALTTARAGAAVTVAPDPTVAGTFYIYAAYGYNSMGATAALQFPSNYEVTTVTATGNTLTETAWTPVAIVGGTGRWLAGAYTATPSIDPGTGTTTYVYFGSGSTNPSTAAGSPSGTLDIGVLGAAGALTITQQAITGKAGFGYGTVTAVDTLFELGGQVTGGFTDKMNGGSMDAPASPTAIGTYGPQGGGQISNGVTTIALFLPGSVAGDAYFWLAGGATGSLAAQTATNDTFFVVY